MSNTVNYSLKKPDVGSTGWGSDVNGNFDTIDAQLKANADGLDGKVPVTRTVNSKALNANITLTASDVGAPSGSGTCSGSNTGDQTLPVKATGAELNTGTDDTKFATAKALADSDYAKTSDIPSVPVKATGAEADTGTDDAKFLTAKAAKDSHNIPSVAPSTSGNVLTSNGTDWTSAAPSAAATVTRGTFVNADLSTGVLTVTHNKGLSAPYSLVVQVFNNSAKMILPDDITGLTNTFTIDLTSYGTLTGTWGYAYIA